MQIVETKELPQLIRVFLSSISVLTAHFKYQQVEVQAYHRVKSLFGKTNNLKFREWTLVDIWGHAPPSPKGSRFFHLNIQNFRNITPSGVGAPTRSTPLREILDPPLMGPIILSFCYFAKHQRHGETGAVPRL